MAGVLPSTSVPAWAPWTGVGTVLAVSLGILSSYGGHPNYHLRLNYVSQLAEAQNPRWMWFCGGLVVGGVMLTAFAWSVRRLLPNPDGLRSSQLGMVAGVFMVLVGFFPLDSIVPHFACAFVLFGSAIFAELFAARSLCRARMPVASRIVFGLFVFHLVAALGGFAYSAIVTRSMRIESPAQMLLESPAIQQMALWNDGPVINPVANLEWVFLATTMGLLLAASAHAWRSSQSR